MEAEAFGVGYYVDTVGKNVNAIERYIMGSEKTTSLLGRVPKVATPIFFYRGRALGCVENARNTYSIPCAFLLAISLPLRKIRALRLLGHALVVFIDIGVVIPKYRIISSQ
jgi:hypothetical protein